MKKALLFALTVIATLILFTGCAETATIEPIFPTLDGINADIAALGEITNLESAAKVSKILEDYQFLDSVSQSKVTDIQKVIDSVETAVTFFEEDDMKLKVMSFNIRYGEFTEDRIDRVIALIEKEAPDIIGVQEATVEWVAVLKERLGEEYEVLGHGREEKLDGESNNALYKKDKFELIESDTKWLTDTPDVWSRHPESACYRIFTYQLLERKSDGQIFLHINTHFDHVGVNARIAQAQILTAWIEETFGNRYPVTITGDFNCTADTEEFNTIINEGFRITSAYGENVRTFNGYSDNGGSIIDFCFVNDIFPVVSYKVCEEKADGEWISDHNAIVSELLLLPAYDSIEFPEE